MVETRLIDRRVLVQINATIIAGMLIFLTIGDFSSQTGFKEITFFTITAGFALLIISMAICFATTKENIQYPAEKFSKLFVYAESAFVAGIMLLFVTVSLVMYMKLFP